MVIGNGMIAKSLSSFNDCEDVLIFASGVSNSMTDNEEEFIREKNLLLNFSRYRGKFIYFSTCSIFDSGLRNSHYVNHKIEMEKIIVDTFTDYLILRLPTVVGKSNNPHVFFNSIKNKLINSEVIHVYKNATRFLIAIDDIPVIVKQLLEFKLPPCSINIAFDNKASALEIVNCMKYKLNSNSKVVVEDRGADLKIDNADFIVMIGQINESFLSVNFETVIMKYI